jgi:signal transduction histidine kinase
MSDERSLFETLSNSNSFQMLSKRLDGAVLLLDEDMHLTYIADGAVDLLACRDLDSLEQLWRTTIAPALTEQACGAGDGIAHGVFEIACDEDGERRRIEVDVELIEEDDCTGYLGIVRDKEILEATETHLRLAAQMRAMTSLYMAVVHDLKAPINAMVVNLELLKESLPDDEKKDRRLRYAKILNEELLRLNRALETILAEASPPSRERARFDLNALLDELDGLLGPQAKRQKTTLEVETPERPLVIQGYRDRLKQAILNLALNALEALGEGGHLTLLAREDNGSARLEVIDDGPGIAEEIQDRVFDMHFSTKSRGTGIGLHVTRSVIESHHGTISFQSESGDGTRFDLTIPLARDLD